MAYTSITVTRSWPATAHFTASGETSVRIVNPADNREPLAWVTSDTDTQPTIATTLSDVIPPRGYEDLILNDGERLWVVCPGLGVSASITAIIKS